MRACRMETRCPARPSVLLPGQEAEVPVRAGPAGLSRWARSAPSAFMEKRVPSLRADGLRMDLALAAPGPLLSSHFSSRLRQQFHANKPRE